MGFSKVRVSGAGAVASKASGSARMQVQPCLVRSLRSLDCNVVDGEAAAPGSRKPRCRAGPGLPLYAPCEVGVSHSLGLEVDAY